MFRSVLLAALVFVPGSALAQSDVAIIDSIPVVIGGLSPGVPGYFGSIEAGTVTKTGPGTFTISDGSTTSKVVVTEPEPCVFEMGIAPDGTTIAGSMRLDANRLVEVFYEENAKSFDVAFKGPEGTMLIVAPSGESRAMPKLSGMKTGLTLEDLQAASQALKEACPTP